MDRVCRSAGRLQRCYDTLQTRLLPLSAQGGLIFTAQPPRSSLAKSINFVGFNNLFFFFFTFIFLFADDDLPWILNLLQVSSNSEVLRLSHVAQSVLSYLCSPSFFTCASASRHLKKLFRAKQRKM